MESVIQSQPHQLYYTGRECAHKPCQFSCLVIGWPLVISWYPDAHSLVYDLYGVVEHHGSQHSGHHTAYCLNQPAATRVQYHKK